MIEIFNWDQFVKSDNTHQKIDESDYNINDTKSLEGKSLIGNSSNEEEQIDDIQEIDESSIDNIEIKLLGYYCQKNQNMHPEEKYTEAANKICSLLLKSFIDIKQKFDSDSQLNKLYSDAVWIFKDRDSNLYSFFPKKEIARLSNVIYNKRYIIKAENQFKFWFKLGENYYDAYNININKREKNYNKSKKLLTPKFNSKTTQEDRDNGFEDEYGVFYNKDMTKLIKAPKELENYIIPEGVEIICFSAFFSCSLKTIVLPSTLKCIGWNAFYRCRELKEIKLPLGLKSIEGEAFVGCTSLQELHIPSSVTYIGPNPVRECGEIKLICDSLNYLIENETLYNKDKTRIISYLGSQEELIISDTVEEIGRSAFCFCTSLRKVVFSNNTKKVYDNAFYYCIKLEEVVINDSLIELGSYVFCGCSQLSNIIIPSNIESIGSCTFGECSSLRKLTIPNNVEGIWYKAFHDCSSLEVLKLSENIEIISDQAFQSCVSLKEIVFPKTIKKIADKAFRYCSRLSTIWFYCSDFSIGDRAFLGCHIRVVHSVPGNLFKLQRLFPNAKIVEDLDIQ